MRVFVKSRPERSEVTCCYSSPFGVDVERPVSPADILLYVFKDTRRYQTFITSASTEPQTHRTRASV